MTIRVQQDQTIYDLANQYYGSVEGVFQIMEDNPSVDLENPLELGKMIVIQDELATNPEVKNYMSTNKVQPNNGNNQKPLVSGFSGGFRKNGFR